MKRKGSLAGKRERERKKVYVRKNVSTARAFEVGEFSVPVKKEPSFSVDGRSGRRGKKRELRGQRATMFPSAETR